MSDELDQPVPADFDWGGGDLSEESDAGFDVLRFTIRGQAFAVEATLVREILALTGSNAVGGSGVEITSVPGLNAPIRGVAMLRRQAVAVIDLADWIGLEGSGTPSDFTPRILVIEHGRLVAGILADAVAGFELWPAHVENDAKQTLSEPVLEISSAARWAPGGVLALLDIPAILEKVAIR